MISLDKKYRTRDGRAVRLLCVDRKGKTPYKVVGLVTDGQDEGIFYWNILGVMGGEPSGVDLIEIKPSVTSYSYVFPSGYTSTPCSSINKMRDHHQRLRHSPPQVGILEITVTEGELPKVTILPVD